MINNNNLKKYNIVKQPLYDTYTLHY